MPPEVQHDQDTVEIHHAETGGVAHVFRNQYEALYAGNGWTLGDTIVNIAEAQEDAGIIPDGVLETAPMSPVTGTLPTTPPRDADALKDAKDREKSTVASGKAKAKATGDGS